MTKILLIEDSSTVRIILKNIFQGLDIDLVECKDGLDALEYIKSHADIDLIISDINMPNISGIELLRTIRTKQLIPGTPYLFLSTEQSKELMAQAKLLGASGWLVKPIDREKLLKAVKKVTGIENLA